MQASLIKKFWSKVEIKSEDSCWNWTAGLSHRGTGKFMSGLRAGFTSIAPRFSWMLHHGPIPLGLLVCHKCDNRLCVNPKPLFLGTHQDNMTDMVTKGRSYKGGPNKGMTLIRKLSDESVRAIRTDPRQLKSIAKDYGISHQLVSRIKSRTAKRNVKD